MAKLYTAQVLEKLGITRVTLDKWVLQKKIKKVTWEKGPGLPHRCFDSQEIEALKGRMVKKPINGKSLILAPKTKRK